IVAALRAAGPPPAAHAVRPTVPRLRLAGAVLGLGAAAVGVALGTATLLKGSSPAPSAGPTAELITLSPPEADVPLSDTQIVGLLAHRPDYGPLGDPQRRASCLTGLGYSAATEILGARPVDVHGRTGVLMVLAGDTPKALVALVVGPNCSSAEAGLLADTVVTRP
ncbi:MAG: hypothetical protein ACRDU5_08675, partial [Mycobacterium sp.]